MAKGDFYFANEGGRRGSRQHQVQTQTTSPQLSAGDFAEVALGSSGQYVVLSATNHPAVGTTYIVGLVAGAAGSNGASTDTTTTSGVVDIYDLQPGDMFYGAPNVVATYFGAGYPATPSQTTYNALVGYRVLWSRSAATAAGITTLLAADSTNNGLVICDMALQDQPSKVKFAIRAGAYYLA